MKPVQPSEVTARAQKTAYENTGKFGCPTGKCTVPIGISYFYDDPLETPITDLGINMTTQQGEAIVQGPKTRGLLAIGLQDSDEGVTEIRQSLGGFVHTGIQMKDSPVNIETDYDRAAEKEAWEIEKNIVKDLHTVEETMKTKLEPYVTIWQKDGLSSAITAYNSGRMKGLEAWWESETDFWNTIPKVAGQVTDAAYAHYSDNPWRLFPPYAAYEVAKSAWNSFGQSAAHAVWEKNMQLMALMKALLYGDINGVVSNLRALTELQTVEGYIGEFGKMLSDALDKGVEWFRDLIEVIRRTPVFGLMARTFMRIIVHMTPNFWAEGMGTFEGYIIPEGVIMFITWLIAGLSAGAGAVLLAARCVSIARKIRALFKGNKALNLLGTFMDAMKKLINKVGDLAKKLRQSIQEVTENVGNTKSKKVLEVRRFRRKLDELAKQGHGPQRHEGDVTDIQLRNRQLHNFDPMTNSIIDHDKFLKKYGIPYDPHVHGFPPDFGGRVINVPGKGELPILMNSRIKHTIGDNATKFNTPADYVRAYEEVLGSSNYAKFLESSKIQGPVEIDMANVFGLNFQSRITGYNVNGLPTKFGANTKIIAIFRNNGSDIKLITMFPEP